MQLKSWKNRSNRDILTLLQFVVVLIFKSPSSYNDKGVSMKKRKKNKVMAMVSGFMLCLCILSVILSGTGGMDVVSAAEKRTVKVAFFPMDGYNVKNGDGSLTGMDVEYLKALEKYVSWDIEYVECGSWDAALKLLELHQVDLVGSAQYSEERAKKFQYADLSSGYTFGVIAAGSGSTLAYEDFEAMKDITFGMVKTYVRREDFLQYLADNGVQEPKIIEYESTAELQEALDKGEIDALVHTFTEIKEGQRLIGRFAPMPFYYITYPGNDDVMRELNQAIADIKINYPELETELMNEFYQSRLDKTIVFTTEEKAYIENADEIVVGYLDGYYPFSYEEDGECRGLTREMLENGLETIGLSLTYEKMASLPEAKAALQDGTIDMIAYCTDTGESLSENKLTVVKEYAEIPLVVVMKENGNLLNTETLATVPYLASNSGQAVESGSVSLVIYDTQQECLNAVRRGEVDAVLCDGYLAEYLLNTEIRYSNLEVKSMLSGVHKVSVVIRDEDGAAFKGILSKALSTINAKMINTYMLENNVYSVMSISNFVRSHSVEIVAALFIILIIVIFITQHMIRDSRKIQKLMYKDSGMNIWNLNYLIYKGESQILPDRREQYAIVNLNVSQFRRYNIIYGWNAGHKLLESIADVLAQKIDTSKEIYARDQGDRFVFLLAYEDKNKFLDRLEGLTNAIEERIMSDTENHMAIQIGVYFIPQESGDLHLAVNYANQAIDFIRNSHKSDIKVYDEALEQAMKERHEREKLLESVEIQKDFVTYYQAKVDIRNEKIIGAEALVRFLDPTAQGAVRSPAFFVPYYEQTGRVAEIDFFVLESVCRMLRRRMDEGKNVVAISCNFSRTHFMKAGFPEHFEAVLDQYRIPKELIEVEITETVVVEELQQQKVKETIDILRKKGVKLSIDDFGSGYSSLGIIEQIPASVIKLDRSFLLNQEDRERQIKIMKGIVNLARDLDAQIVCEGVETDRDVELMQEIGAFVAQGYRYSKPMPEAEFERRLSNN